VTRLERVFELLDEKARGKHCAGMAGILEEGTEKMQQDLEDSVLDACLIASAQKVEHYEIGAYGTAIAWAEALELSEIAQILGETLAEEKAADEKLSALAESGINDAATAGESEEEYEDGTQPASRESGRSGATAKGAAEKSARTRGGRR
jgi:ferritin-like metal-binding protein YciE